MEEPEFPKIFSPTAARKIPASLGREKPLRLIVNTRILEPEAGKVLHVEADVVVRES